MEIRNKNDRQATTKRENNDDERKISRTLTKEPRLKPSGRKME
jgi:hypothetical protein